ncbi:MAG: hypothetical protein ACQESC_03075 [Nanobdellota archaeon]
MAKKPEKQTQGMAIVALLLNILILPGLGSLIAKKTKEGTIQLVVFLISIPLSFVIIGIPIGIAMWVWALITGIQIVKESE